MTTETGDLPTNPTRSRLERTTLREILMGAQDNLTNVLAVVLGVALGAGRADLVALAGVAAGVAEAVSMGGVLYTATRAATSEGSTEVEATAASVLSPGQSGLLTFAAAIIAAAIPLAPFAVLPLAAAMVASVVVSVAALFGLGAWTGRIAGRTWWREGLRMLTVAGMAAIAAALVGGLLRVDVASASAMAPALAGTLP